MSLETICVVAVLDRELGAPGDDRLAVETAAALARDAGFDPVFIGGLDRSADLDATSPIYAKSMTASAVRRALRL